VDSGPKNAPGKRRSSPSFLIRGGGGKIHRVDLDQGEGWVGKRPGPKRDRGLMWVRRNHPFIPSKQQGIVRGPEMGDGAQSVERQHYVDHNNGQARGGE